MQGIFHDAVIYDFLMRTAAIIKETSQAQSAGRNCGSTITHIIPELYQIILPNAFIGGAAERNQGQISIQHCIDSKRSAGAIALVSYYIGARDHPGICSAIEITD